MNNVFEIEGNAIKNGEILANIYLKDIAMYINIPEWINERNIYRIDNKEQFATLKPSKFGGLTYRIIDYIDDYAKIKTRDFGECLVRIKATTITNYPVYEKGWY